MFYWKADQYPLRNFTLFIAIVLCLSACNGNRMEVRLYPIDSLVTAQIASLTELKAELHKEAVMAGKMDSSTYTPKDSLAWADELDIFRQLQVMNKPVSQASYLIDDSLYDPGSNLTVKAFTSTTDLPVRHLRVYYSHSIMQPRKIEAHYKEQNALYQSSRMLLLEFQQVNNRTVLTSYSIEGGQKMILGDSVVFSVKGKILID